MPVMSGLDVARAISRLRADLPEEDELCCLGAVPWRIPIRRGYRRAAGLGCYLKTGGRDQRRRSTNTATPARASSAAGGSGTSSGAVSRATPKASML